MGFTQGSQNCRLSALLLSLNKNNYAITVPDEPIVEIVPVYSNDDQALIRVMVIVNQKVLWFNYYTYVHAVTRIIFCRIASTVLSLTTWLELWIHTTLT